MASITTPTYLANTISKMTQILTSNGFEIQEIDKTTYTVLNSASTTNNVKIAQILHRSFFEEFYPQFHKLDSEGNIVIKITSELPLALASYGVIANRALMR